MNKIYKKIGIIFLGCLIMTSIGCTIWNIDNYYQRIYPYRKTMANFDRIEASTDLDEIADYCKKVYNFIEQFSGNPDWAYWAKTDRTNWNLIKQDFKNVINDIKEAINNTKPGDEGYQKTLEAIKDSLFTNEKEDEEGGLKEQISETHYLEVYKQTWQIFWLGIGIWLIFFSLMILAFIKNNLD